MTPIGRWGASVHPLAIAVAIAGLTSMRLDAQLTTGILEGTVHDSAGNVASRLEMLITGGLRFETTVRTDAAGRFSMALPYGRYSLRTAGSGESIAVIVVPLQTNVVNLVVDGLRMVRESGGASRAFGLWSERLRTATFPEGFTLQSMLASRQRATVTMPLDFTGLADNRLALVSNRAFSWTATQFKLNGLDATDSYQPGRPAVLPDIQAISDVVVRTGSRLTTSESYGNEVGVFTAEPGESWHGAVSTFDTGSGLSSGNLPNAASRGEVQQNARFRWFTRDGVEVGGPLTKWADVFGAAGGQWSRQTVESAPPGEDQNSRMLFASLRGRIRASAHDKFAAEYSGARLTLSDWGIPAGIEALVSRRMSPEFSQPNGLSDEAENDGFTFVEAAWTHVGSDTLEVRYGYSTARFATWPRTQRTPNQSRIELLGSAVTGAPPLSTIANRPRHEVEMSWQHAGFETGTVRHQITAGGDWKRSTPRNRMSTPSDMNLITADGVPAFA
ncbi:MAG: carboxypeptidase regulatory-like domain-containing protein, partial [Acidobacteriaceae bacterium]|nr:carboxypeptidase regulatory-like domain-containing protein [Acidobacteriaceae bacterium]